MIPVAWEIIPRIYKWDYKKKKVFPLWRKQPPNLKRTIVLKRFLASCMSYKELISRICKEIWRLNPNAKSFNWLNRTFSKEGLQIAGQYLKKCCTSFTLRELLVKTPLRCQVTAEWLSSRRDSHNAGHECGESRNFIYCWWNCYRYQYGGFL